MSQRVLWCPYTSCHRLVGLGLSITVSFYRWQGRQKRPWQRCKDTAKSDMSCWGLEQEDVHDRVLWHSLIELGASRMAIRKGYSPLGENSDKIENIPCTSLSFTDTCILWSCYHSMKVSNSDVQDVRSTCKRQLEPSCLY